MLAGEHSANDVQPSLLIIILHCLYIGGLEYWTIIGASVSEPPLVDSTDALSRYIYIYIYIYYIRPAPATAHARRYAQT